MIELEKNSQEEPELGPCFICGGPTAITESFGQFAVFCQYPCCFCDEGVHRLPYFSSKEEAVASWKTAKYLSNLFEIPILTSLRDEQDEEQTSSEPKQPFWKRLLRNLFREDDLLYLFWFLIGNLILLQAVSSHFDVHISFLREVFPFSVSLFLTFVLTRSLGEWIRFFFSAYRKISENR